MRKIIYFLSVCFLTIPIKSQIIDLTEGNLFYGFYEEIIPFQSDLLSNYSIRSGNYFIDDVNGDTATILMPTYTNVSGGRLQGSSLRDEELIWDGNDYTIYFRLTQVDSVNVGVSTLDIVNFGTSGRYLRWYFYFQNVRLRYSDGTTTYTHNVYTTNNGLLNYDYADVLVNIDGTGQTLNAYIYAPDGSTIGSASQDISAFNFNSTVNSGSLYFECKESAVVNFRKFQDIKTLSECVDFTDTTNNQLFYPDILSGTNILEDSNHLERVTVDYDDTTYIKWPYPLDFGFNDYQFGIDDDVEPHIHIPYLYDGSYVDPDFSDAGVYIAGSRIVGERPGNVNGINAYDYKLRFSNAFFDRSNTTIWNDSARLSAASRYSANSPYDFHSSELNQRNFYEWLNDGYRGRLYVHYNGNSIERWDRDLLSNIYLYNTDKKTTENASVLAYTGDNIARVGTSYDAQNYVELGYLQADSAMLSFRVDDAPVSALSGWMPVWDTSGITAITGPHAGETGTTGTYEYLDFAELNVLIDSGWILADHNYYEEDWNDPDNLDSIEIYMRLAQQVANDSANGFRDYIGNRHSSASPSMSYYAHKVGYRTHNAWGDYNRPTNEANPVYIDPFRINGLACDLSGPYYLEDTDNSQEIQNLKDQIDLCVSEGRWMVIFVHNYSQKVSDALAEIINYANDNNCGIVPYEDAYNQIQYRSK